MALVIEEDVKPVDPPLDSQGSRGGLRATANNARGHSPILRFSDPALAVCGGRGKKPKGEGDHACQPAPVCESSIQLDARA
jgi:hypothetical protein